MTTLLLCLKTGKYESMLLSLLLLIAEARITWPATKQLTFVAGCAASLANHILGVGSPTMSCLVLQCSMVSHQLTPIMFTGKSCRNMCAIKFCPVATQPGSTARHKGCACLQHWCAAMHHEFQSRRMTTCYLTPDKLIAL